MSKAVPRFKRISPPLPALTGAVYLITVSGTIDTQRWYCNFGYQASSFVQVAASESNLNASWITACLAALKACLSNDAIVDTVKVACVSSPTRAPFVQQGGGLPVAGTGGVSHYPTPVAGIIAKYTATRGQHGRGRNYLPAVPIGFVTPASNADQLNASGQTAYNAFATALDVAIADTGGVTADVCVYTRVAKGLSVLNAEDVLQLVVRPLLGTIRRRRVGRGK